MIKTSGPHDSLSRPHRLAMAIVIAVLPFFRLAAQPLDPSLLNEWNNPAFLKTFTGDLGIRTDVEPTVSQQERALIAEILPNLTLNPSQALARLSPEVNAQSSAALDFLLGHLNNVVGRRPQAAKHYETAVGKFPNFLRAHKWLGHFYFEQQNFLKATEAYNRVISIGGGDEFTHGRLAYCLLNRRAYVSAETAFRQASVANPENPRWQSGLARCSLQQGRPRAALSIIEELLQREPGKQSHWLLKANAHLAANEPRRAIVSLEAAGRLGRLTAAMQVSLGDLYLNEDLAASAITSYEAALNENPDAAEPGVLRAVESLLSREQADSASKLLRTFESLASPQSTRPQNAPYQRLKLWLALLGDSPTEAAATLESYLARHPMDNSSIARLADYFTTTNQTKSAERYYRQALRIDGNDTRIRLKLAQLLTQKRRFAEALAEVQTCLRSDQTPQLERYAQQLESLLDTP